MVDKTLEENLTGIQEELYLAAGVGTQVYAQDMIITKIIDAYRILSTDPDVKWKRYWTYQTFTLDGVTGRTVVPIVDTFGAFENVWYIYVGDSETKLTFFTMENNPARITGDRARFYSSDNQDILKVIPSTASGDITVVGRTDTVPTELTHIVKFDYLAIKYFVCWQITIDDAANAGAAEKFRALFTERYNTLKKMDQESPIAINGQGQVDYPRDWFIR